jgi:hypothetical protein
VSGNLMQARDPLGLAPGVVSIGFKGDIALFEGASVKFGIFVSEEENGEIRVGVYGDGSLEAGVGAYGGAGIEISMLRGDGQDGLDGTDVGAGVVAGAGLSVGISAGHSVDDLKQSLSEYWDSYDLGDLQSENEYSPFLGWGAGAMASVEVSHTKSFALFTFEPGDGDSKGPSRGAEVKAAPGRPGQSSSSKPDRKLMDPPGATRGAGRPASSDALPPIPERGPDTDPGGVEPAAEAPVEFGPPPPPPANGSSVDQAPTADAPMCTYDDA